MTHPIIAAVDLGSNSFRMQIARVVAGEPVPLENFKGTVRLGAGLGQDQMLTEDAQERALVCLARFGEHLRELPPEAVRAVGTNTWRIARNAREFLQRAEATLGYPIEVIGGIEEARLIYIGAAHSLPPNNHRRLVVDIGGGSTEFIIGRGFQPTHMESVQLGCVPYSQRYFPHGTITATSIDQAVLSARARLQAIVRDFGHEHWDEAIGTSGSARSLAEIFINQRWCDSGITIDALNRLRDWLIRAKRVEDEPLAGLRPDRSPVLLGGYAIMAAVFAELGIREMRVTLGALRDGVLYDLIDRQHSRDTREQTVLSLGRAYNVDPGQARRVLLSAELLFGALNNDANLESLELESARAQLAWAAHLHEVGLSIAHASYHRHSAYIVENADMPGFSRPEQAALARLVLAHRGGLRKVAALLEQPVNRGQVLALRLAAIFCRSRRETDLPPFTLTLTDGGAQLSLPADWCRDNGPVLASLSQEQDDWAEAGYVLLVGCGND